MSKTAAGLLVSSAVLWLAAAPAALGSVFRWGNDGAGTIYRPAPSEIKNIAEAVAIDASNASSYALMPNGRVWAQGSHQDGALGDDNAVKTAEAAVEVELPPGAQASAIGEAEHAGYAIVEGHLWSWGNNEAGVACLGSSLTSAPVPTEVPGITNAVEVQGAALHVLIRLANGTVDVCGTHGIGLGATAKVTEPTPIPGLTHIVQVSAGEHTSGVRTASGEVLTFGENSVGQLGDGNTKNSDKPVHVQLPGPASWLSVGGSDENGHCEALVNGVPYGWGWDESGEVGDGSEADKLMPVVDSRLMGMEIESLVASGFSTLALTQSGELYSLGVGEEIGTLTGESSLMPIPIASGVVEISGTAHNQLMRTG